MKPQGTVMAGSPVALLGLVHLAVIPAPGPLVGYSTPPTDTVPSQSAMPQPEPRSHQKVYVLQDTGIILFNDPLYLHSLGVVPSQDELPRPACGIEQLGRSLRGPC